jgi:succinylarginine dihydrolase
MSRGDGRLVEINFDGIIGPSHNYAGLSPGNLAATRNRGLTAHPRAAALQGIAKMRANLRLRRRARAPAGAGAIRLGDVGRQCRDGLAGTRYA